MTTTTHFYQDEQHVNDWLVHATGRYRIVSEIGSGGMAVVYLAKDLSLDRDVAVKVLHPHLSNHEQARARFRREAQAVARLRHPNIIEIHDFAQPRNRLSYLICEYVQGQTLKSFLERHETYFPELAVMIGIKLCEAIEHAHDLNVIHRDLKPENIMVSNTGILKLMDFGIAKVIDHTQQMTQTGTILGSPAHMAPELFEGKDLDFRSDLFSLGTILYWIATGNLPFFGKNPHQVIKQIVQGSYPNPLHTCPIMSIKISDMLTTALHLLPEKRFQSAASMRENLLGCLEGLDLDDIDQELSDFFSDPEKYLPELRFRLSKKIFLNGRKAWRAGRHQKALVDLDRVLALEPDNPDVGPLIHGIQRRRRLRTACIATACVAVIVTMILFGSSFGIPDDLNPQIGSRLKEFSSQPNPKGATIKPFDSIFKDNPLPDLFTIQSSDHQAPSAPKYEQPENPEEATPFDPVMAKKTLSRKAPGKKIAHLSTRAIKIPVKIYVDPYFDQILVNGNPAGNNNRSTMYGQRFTARLAPGKYQIRLQRRGCHDDEFQLVVPRRHTKPIELRRHLQFRPASLIIQTPMKNTKIWVDSIFKGHALSTRSEPIEIFMEGFPGVRKISLRLVNDNLGEIRKQLWVKAGEQNTLNISAADFKSARKLKQPTDEDTP